jgi:hypothetical protein
MRFVEEVALKYEGDDCLTWPFACALGYAHITVAGKNLIASRYICRRVYGDPPDETYHAAHNCNAGHLGCVNPRHLEWKTALENSQDRIRAGRSTRGESNASAKLTADQVREIRRMKGTIGARKIGLVFGVSETTVLDIHRRKKWAHLDATT